MGLRIGALVVGIAAAVALAVIGFKTYQARTGRPGGEILIPPTYILFFYAGWTAHRDIEEYQHRTREEKKP